MATRPVNGTDLAAKKNSNVSNLTSTQKSKENSC